MTVVSFDPETTLVPSLVKARQLTADLWPLEMGACMANNYTMFDYFTLPTKYSAYGVGVGWRGGRGG